MRIFFENASNLLKIENLNLQNGKFPTRKVEIRVV